MGVDCDDGGTLARAAWEAEAMAVCIRLVDHPDDPDAVDAARRFIAAHRDVLADAEAEAQRAARAAARTSVLTPQQREFLDREFDREIEDIYRSLGLSSDRLPVGATTRGRGRITRKAMSDRRVGGGHI